jgi:hypothetical protein
VNRADRYLLLAFAFASAILYSSLLPLWEGFDEPWHYGYVQSLSVTRRLPVLGETRLSQEVWDSMLACPASHVGAHAWPELQTFDRYFALSAAARAKERSVLEAIPRGEATLPGGHTNYEAQQPPLAYALLAAPDWLLSRTSIPLRVLWLRIFAACLAALITFLAASSLFRTLALPPAYQALGTFSIFACQMYWATSAHIANDALGLAFTVWFVAACAAFSAQPGTSGAPQLALVTSLGLLTKAYFLPLFALGALVVAYRRVRALPVFAGIVVVLAGPWYARNLLLYHNVSGLLMASGGVSPVSSLAAVDWSRTIPYMLRATLWTGNNSFTSFSSLTLNCLLALLAVGVVAYFFQASRRGITAAEWSVLGFLAVYGAAVILVVGNDVVFLKGASAGAAPWYTIVLLAPALAIVFLGLSRSHRWGHLTAAAIVLLWSYICIATYVVKLIPLYGGYSKGRMTLKETLDFYGSSHHELTSMLSTISLAPPFVIYAGTAVVVSLAVTIAVRLVPRLTKPGEKTLVSSTRTW